MADLTFKATLDNKISPELQKIQKDIEKVNSAFESMKNAIVGLAFGALLNDVMKFGDEISDTAKAFGATTAEVLALSSALEASGGSGDNVVKMFQGIANAVDDLNQGNLKTLTNFEKLGFTLAEIGKLSESEIREKVINNLAEMTNKTEAAALAVKMFGKAAIGVDFTELAKQIKQNKEESERYADAINTAGDAFDNLQKITKQIKVAFAEAFQPLFDALANIKISTDSIITAFKVLLQVILPIVVALTAVKAAIIACEVAMAAFNAVSNANPWVLGAKVIIAGLTAAGIAIATNTDTQKENNNETKKASDLTKITVVNTEELTNKLKVQRDELGKIGKEYENNTRQLQAQMGFVWDTYKLSQVQASQQKAMAELQLKFQNDLINAKKEFEKLDIDAQNRNKQAYLENIANINKQYDTQRALLHEKIAEEAITKNATRAMMDNANVQVENLKTLIQMRSDTDKLTMSAKERLDEEYNVKGVLESIAILQQKITDADTLSTFQKRDYLLELSKVKTVQDALALSEKLSLQVYDSGNFLLKQKTDILEKQKNVADKLRESQRSFSTGWTQAFNEYMDNATNAAKRAGEIFNSVTSNMNSAIDNFVTTGKFSFSDFARSVIQDLIKIELKAQATQLMKGLGGAGGIFSAIGSLLGFAEGGSPPINKPSIVGEKGPELFVPKTAGTVVPNNMLGGGSQTVSNTYITNNISAIDAKSVAQLFAENRKTLLGTIQLAQKELPYANR